MVEWLGCWRVSLYREFESISLQRGVSKAP
jgi:hypothetical protein